MLGLIKKDLLMIKGNWKLVLIIFIVFICMAANGDGNFAFIPALISVMLFMSTFSYDEYSKWDIYAFSLPNGRKDIVKAKYVATIILILGSILLTMVLCLLTGYLKHKIEISYTLNTMFGCGAGVLILQSILYPLIFKFGIEKSRIGIFVGVFGVTGIISFLLEKGLTLPENLVTLLNNYSMIIIPIFIIVMLLISYKISVFIYQKKEF